VVDLRYPQKVPEDASVTTDSIADGSITNDKLAEPVSVANGGTGKTTAAAGLAALGGASLNGSSTVAFNASTINGVAPLTANEKTQALVGSSTVSHTAQNYTIPSSGIYAQYSETFGNIANMATATVNFVIPDGTGYEIFATTVIGINNTRALFYGLCYRTGTDLDVYEVSDPSNSWTISASTSFQIQLVNTAGTHIFTPTVRLRRCM
jgi:hypothetical protein